VAGRYLLEKRLGRGAMGQVYLARDENLITRRVAVKTVRPDILTDEDMQEGEAIARFEREARTAASIRHPNVVDVTDFGKTPEGVFFLVMEYVEGETLHHLLRREGTLSPKRTLTLLRQVAEGVEAAHDAGILHRDLKPANIFIMQKRKKSGATTDDGFIKVGDFGLAKIVNDAVAEAISASGPASRGIIGTPEYMSPEQMQPGATLDARADVYAIGTIAYHMLGGRPPFTGDLPQLIMQKMMNAPPPLTTLRSDVSPEVERAVMHALERDVEQRSANVPAWLEEFEAAVGEESDDDEHGDSRVVILAPAGAEVYLDDERYGSIGRSGRVILNSIPPGQHVLRVARSGELDDERVIEIRPGANEQVIQAQLRHAPTPSQFTPSRGGPGSGIGSGPHSSIPGVIMCAKCGARFAAGARFCGRCGGTVLYPVADAPGGPAAGASHVGGQSVSGGPRSIGGSPAPGSGHGGAASGYNVPAPSAFICPSCGLNLPAGTRFCGRCGMNTGAASAPPPTHTPPRPVPIVCRQCSTSYPPGTRFCGRCGTVI
jgi:serine/threonine protein kinase/ribosomal protein L40E